MTMRSRLKLPTLSRPSGRRDDGRLERVAELTRSNREAPDPATEEELVRLRHGAFAELGARRPRPAAPESVVPNDDPVDDGIPAIAASQMSAGRIAAAIGSHGAVIIRGLVEPKRAAELATGIDRAFDARDAAEAGAGREDTTPWYVPFAPEEEASDAEKAAVKIGRGFVTGGSGMWLADSPRMLFELIETFDDAGLREVIGEYLGERPAISVNKGTLRRARPGVPSGWHQDGAFLGESIRSLNVWLSLTHCGERAPGMELVPRRLDRIVETGTRGAQFDWSVSDEVAEEASGGRFAWPIFQPGDALLFDHLNLHRTAVDDSMTETRYATETWFFAPSAYPDRLEQVPLAL